MTSATMGPDRTRHQPAAAPGPVAAQPQLDLYRPYRTPSIIRDELDRTGNAIRTLETELHRAEPDHDPTITDTARRLTEYRARLAQLTAELEAAQVAPWPLIIIACGHAKRQGFHRVDDLYVGTYHRAAKAAALRLTTPARVRVLSARYGFLRLCDSVNSYEMTMGSPGSVTTATLAAQAAGLDGCVIVLAGRVYATAALTVFPQADTPLAGTRGIGDHMRRLSRLGR
jgi:hypothetical protein